MNDSTSKARDNTVSENSEKHSFQFRGVFLHAEFMYMVMEQHISSSDVFLILMIDALSSRDEGCWASNIYLANTIKVSPHHISKTLTKLAKKKLIKITYGKKHGQECRWISVVPQGVRDFDDVSSKSQQAHTSHFNHVPIGLPKEEEVNTEEEIHCRPATQSGADAPSLAAGDKEIQSNTQLKPIKSRNTVSDASVLAVKFYEELLKHSRTNKKPNFKDWARKLTSLAGKVDGGMPTVSASLSSYYSHIGESYWPDIRCPASLDAKWDKLMAAIERSKQPSKSTASIQPASPPQLSKEEQWIYDQVKDMNWPKDTKSQLPAAIHESYAAYSILRVLMYKYLKYCENKRITSTDNYYLCRHILSTTLPPDDFVSQWYKQTNGLVNWNKWNGTNLPVLSLSLKRFVDEARGWAAHYSGRPQDWDDLMAEIVLVREDS